MALTLSYAQAAARALATAMQRDSRVVALGEDLGRGGVFGQYVHEGQTLQQRFGAERDDARIALHGRGQRARGRLRVAQRQRHRPAPLSSTSV